jgi:hypothetical protein
MDEMTVPCHGCPAAWYMQYAVPSVPVELGVGVVDRRYYVGFYCCCYCCCYYSYSYYYTYIHYLSTYLGRYCRYCR